MNAPKNATELEALGQIEFCRSQSSSIRSALPAQIRHGGSPWASPSSA
jgi:hypothetical protein